jgi:hypothetical protein
MATILRWFHAEGVRHRAYIRRDDAATPELVIAGRDWQVSKVTTHPTLDEYSDDELIHLVQTLRPAVRSAELEAAVG